MMTIGRGWVLAAALGLGGVAVGAVPKGAGGPGLPAEYAGPARVDLSGVWDFRLDEKREGEAAGWSSGSGAEGWRQLAVPGSYNELLAKNAGMPEKTDAMRFYKGAAWYRRSFTAAGCGEGMVCSLHLSGTVIRHKVWVNGQAVGESRLPYLEAVYDVTQVVKRGGGNVVVVEVDNEVERRAIPDKGWNGWWNDGGLIRPVYLEVRPEVHGQSYATTKMAASGWELNVETKVQRGSSGKDVAVSYALTDRAGKVIWRKGVTALGGEGGASVVAAGATLQGVAAWSPERPVLYTLTTTIGSGRAADVTRVKIGFRQVETKGSQILLNGAPIVVKGISRHQFLAGKGMSLTIAEDRRDLEDIKSLGANFVRLTHYTQSQDMYDLCDELGLMVWTEIPAWHTSEETLADPKVWEESAKPQLTQMVMQHWNHPSVVVWSVGNEIPTDRPPSAAYVAKAIAYVKSLDRSRLVSFASDRREKDLAIASVDVIATNEYFGWYYGKQEDVGPSLDALHAMAPAKPILVTEYGTEAVAGWDAATAPKDSRDYSYAAQTSFMKKHMEQIYAPERSGYMAGGVVWVYNDFPDEHRVGGDHPEIAKYRNNKGIVTMDRKRKPSYGVVKEFFAGVK